MQIHRRERARCAPSGNVDPAPKRNRGDVVVVGRAGGNWGEGGSRESLAVPRCAQYPDSTDDHVIVTTC